MVGWAGANEPGSVASPRRRGGAAAVPANLTSERRNGSSRLPRFLESTPFGRPASIAEDLGAGDFTGVDVVRCVDRDDTLVARERSTASWRIAGEERIEVTRGDPAPAPGVATSRDPSAKPGAAA